MPIDLRTDTRNVVHATADKRIKLLHEAPTQMNLGNSSHTLKKSGPKGHKLHNAIYMKSQKAPKVSLRLPGAGEREKSGEEF